MLGVHPKLVEQINQGHDAKHQRWHTDQCHRQIKHPADGHAGGGLSQCRGQVVVLALVMHHMTAPKERHFVTGAVVPVITKVIKHQGHQHTDCALPKIRVVEQRHLLKHQGVQGDAKHAGEHGAQLTDHAQADAVDRVIPTVGLR